MNKAQPFTALVSFAKTTPFDYRQSALVGAQDEMIPMKLEFYGYGISRTMLACAGMGATMGMLVGGTTFGVPTAIVAAIIGAIGGGVLGRFVEWKEQHSGSPSKRRRGSGQTRHYARSISERALHLENSDLGNQAEN